MFSSCYRQYAQGVTECDGVFNYGFKSVQISNHEGVLFLSPSFATVLTSEDLCNVGNAFKIVFNVRLSAQQVLLSFKRLTDILLIVSVGIQMLTAKKLRIASFPAHSPVTTGIKLIPTGLPSIPK